MKRIVSLVLVLALVFSIFAIPAQASAVGTGLLIGVSAVSVVASALIGLGILPGTDGSVFDGLVNDAVLHLQSLGFGDGTTIPVLKYLGTGGGIRYALQTAALTALRSWLFAENVVSVSSTSFSGSFNFSAFSYTFTSSVPIYPCVFKYHVPSLTKGYFYSLFVFSDEYGSVSLSTNGGSSQDKYLTSSSYSYGYYSRLGTHNSSSSTVTTDVLIIDLGDFSDSSVPDQSYPPDVDWHSFLQSSSYDVTFGDVAPEDEEISVAYPSWGYGSVEIPGSGDDEDPDPFIPITLLPTYEDTKSQTQEEAQSGTSTLETDNSGTSVDISGDVGGSITPDDGSSDLPEGEEYPTVSDLTTMFAWLASSIDRSVELLFPDLQVIKTYLKTIAQWHETDNVKYDSIISYLSGFDTDLDTMLTNLANIDLNVTTMLGHAENSVTILTGIASDLKDIRDVIADPLDSDINESQTDNKTAFLNNFATKSQADNIGDLAGLSGGFTEWFALPDVDITSMFDQVESGYGQWFTSETAQSISVGGGAAAVAAAAGVELMEDQEYVPPQTPYLDAWDQEVQDILAGGDGEW